MKLASGTAQDLARRQRHDVIATRHPNHREHATVDACMRRLLQRSQERDTAMDKGGAEWTGDSTLNKGSRRPPSPPPGPA